MSRDVSLYGTRRLARYAGKLVGQEQRLSGESQLNHPPSTSSFWACRIVLPQDARPSNLGVKWLKSICVQSLLSSRHPVDQIAERNLLFSSAFPNVNGPCPGAEKLNGEVAPPPVDIKNITGMNTNHAGLGPFASLFSRQIVWSRTGSVYRVRYSPSFTNRASLGSPSSRSFCQSQE